MKVTHVFMALAAADHAAALGWYVQLFGRGPDMIPTEGEAVWRLAGSASVYVVADPIRAGRAALTIAVRDVDVLLADLREHGIVGDDRDGRQDAHSGRRWTRTETASSSSRTLAADAVRRSGIASLPDRHKSPC